MPLIFMCMMIVLLGLSLYLSQRNQEPYMDRYCNEHGNCYSCMKTAGCAWCPLAKKCRLASTIKSEEKCNADNAITALDKCKKEKDIQLEEAYDDPSSENVKSKPPAIYTTSETDYSHQTVMADVSKLREEVDHLRQDLPDMIASTVRQTLSPAPFHRI